MNVHCQYVAEWVGTKKRWALTVDEPEMDALKAVAEECSDTNVQYEIAP
ncbi:hypothetical protein J7I98_29325 [Streptomyces sp. ISL-98]|nr:hypothetical protein [Streptomyces sp. ISL-98]MBT2509892.1 hypothetical protein [Streptomyces sp. ISL-98]